MTVANLEMAGPEDAVELEQPRCSEMGANLVNLNDLRGSVLVMC